MMLQMFYERIAIYDGALANRAVEMKPFPKHFFPDYHVIIYMDNRTSHDKAWHDSREID